MATSKLFKKVPITVPNRSGFNMSHNNFFSAPVGTLIPNFIDFLIPGDEIDLSSKVHVQLPPMATDFYGRIEAKEEAFFVPARILFGGWKDFYVNPVDGITNPSNIDGQLAKYLIGASIGSSIMPKSLNLPLDSIPQVFTHSDLDGLAGVIKYNEYTQITTSQLQVYKDIYSLLDTLSTYLLDIVNPDGNPQTYIDQFFSSTSDSFNSQYGAGSLLDYLGFKVQSSSSAGDNSTLKGQIYNFGTALSSLIIGSQPNLANSNNALNPLITDLYDYGSYTVSGGGKTFGTITVKNLDDDETSFYIRVTMAGVTDEIGTVNTPSIKIPNILPLMAYHKIYDDWYRAPQIQQSLFKRNIANQSTATSVANMPWITSGADSKIYFSGDQLKFANGHSLFDLHQRNWQKDYFTSATPEPQAGEASSVKFDIVNDSGEFTIASLRAANALQQWLDRNNIGGFRYGDMIYAQYGVYPSDAITDRAIYLGSSTTEVYNKSIYQQSGDGGTDTNNPFNAIGSKYSNPTGIGQGNFCNNYKVTEAGFVIKIYSLVPQAYYSTGVRRFFMHNDISDIAFPVLAGVGDQPIYGYELTDTYSGDGDKTVFGYVQRYADYKFIDDQVHGLLRDGESLDSFALQRSFKDVPSLGSDFLEIPRDYLDQVSATSYKLSEYGCWVNCYNDYRKSSTLPAYSIPTLEDMKGHTVMVDKGGTYLD